MAYVLGIDLGTQSVKTGILDTDNGVLECNASRKYHGGALQQVGELWNATLDAVTETMEQSRGAAVQAVGLSGQMHGAVLYGGDRKSLGDIVNWQDERCNATMEKYGGRTTIDRMLELIPADAQADLGIDRMASGFQAATLFHIRENEPELFGVLTHVLSPTDFLRRRLTGGGDFVTDPTNAFGTGVFDTRRGRWHEDVIRALELPMEIFPEIRDTTDVAGHISPFTAKSTGLKAGTPVIVGGGDNQMAMLGAGALTPDGPICVNIGTSSQVCVVADEYRKIDGIDCRSFFNGRFALVYAGLAGGKSYTWLRNNILGDLASVQATTMRIKDLFEAMDERAGDAPPGCDGLRFEPFLRGTRKNPELRASFTGIGMKNFTMGHRARAVMEGVVNELVTAMESMDASPDPPLAGAGNGLVRSELWRKITAGAFGRTMLVTDFENAVCGAALAAAHGTGIMDMAHAIIDYTYTVHPD